MTTTTIATTTTAKTAVLTLIQNFVCIMEPNQAYLIQHNSIHIPSAKKHRFLIAL